MSSHLNEARLKAELRAMSVERDANETGRVRGIRVSRLEFADPRLAERHLKTLKETSIEMWTKQSNESSDPHHRGKPEVFAAEYKFDRPAMEEWRVQWITEQCIKNDEEWLRKEASRTSLSSRSKGKAPGRLDEHMSNAASDVSDRPRKIQRTNEPKPDPDTYTASSSIPNPRSQQSRYIPPRNATWTQPSWVAEYGRRSKFDEGLRSQLTPIRHLINQYESTPNPALCDQIREQLHMIELLDVDAATVVISRLLHPSLGLPRLFTGSVRFPHDISADAEALCRRWYREDFEADIFRGIKFVRKRASLDKNYPCRQIPGSHGYGHLVNGQWWPSRLCLVRDGAHGALEAGIHGKDGTAASVILSGHHYQDIDNGDEVFYCGTAKKNDEDTKHTRLLQNSVHRRDSDSNRLPIRLFRTSTAKESGVYQPSVGIRFDGLYEAMSFQEVPNSGGLLRFRLVRMPGQDPIRYQGIGKRPSEQEVTELNKHSQLMAQIGVD